MSRIPAAAAVLLPLLLLACVAPPPMPPGAVPYAEAPSGACGMRGYRVPIGTPVVEATFTQRDRPFMGFGQSPVPIVRADVLSPPCEGRLAKSSRPLGFRYLPRPGYLGNDSYVIRGCTSRGQCVIQATVITIAP